MEKPCEDIFASGEKTKCSNQFVSRSYHESRLRIAEDTIIKLQSENAVLQTRIIDLEMKLEGLKEFTQKCLRWVRGTKS